MKTIIITHLLFLFAGIPAVAQSNIDKALAAIAENNTTLKALRQSAEAGKLGNKTGIHLPGPELGFNYLFGNPGEIGNRTDFNVMQSFDFATLSGLKSRAANERNSLVELQYQTDRLRILLEAKQYCLDLIYHNALLKELHVRSHHAGVIAEAYEKRLETGDAGILECNKAKLNLSSVQGEIARVEVERNTIRSQLKRLNGGKDIALDDTRFQDVLLPPDFDQWFARSAQKYPALALLKQEIEVSRKELSVNKAMTLPSLSAGYMSERVAGERYQGVSVAISIPLWENKNRIKQAKAAVRAAELKEDDSRQQFYNQLRILYDRTQGLRTAAHNYRRALETINNAGLLMKALDAGEISLLDYIVEMGLCYDTINQAMETERDYQRAFAELSAVEL